MHLYSITNLVELELTLLADIGFFLLGLITFSLEKLDLSRPNTDAMLSVPTLLPCLSFLSRSLVKTLALILHSPLSFRGKRWGYIGPPLRNIAKTCLAEKIPDGCSISVRPPSQTPFDPPTSGGT